MTALNTALLKRVETILRRDPVVAKNVRWHDASITIVCDAKRWTFEVREGQITLEADERPREQPEIDAVLPAHDYCVLDPAWQPWKS